MASSLNLLPLFWPRAARDPTQPQPTNAILRAPVAPKCLLIHGRLASCFHGISLTLVRSFISTTVMLCDMLPFRGLQGAGAVFRGLSINHSVSSASGSCPVLQTNGMAVRARSSTGNFSTMLVPASLSSGLFPAESVQRRERTCMPCKQPRSEGGPRAGIGGCAVSYFLRSRIQRSNACSLAAS